MIRYSGVARHQQTTVGDGGKEAVGKPVVASARCACDACGRLPVAVTLLPTFATSIALHAEVAGRMYKKSVEEGLAVVSGEDRRPQSCLRVEPAARVVAHAGPSDLLLTPSSLCRRGTTR